MPLSLTMPRSSAPVDDGPHLPNHPFARNRDVRDRRQAFPRRIAYDVRHPEPPPIGKPVVNKVDRPAAVRAGRQRDRCACHCDPAGGFASPDRRIFLAAERPCLPAVRDMAIPERQEMQATVSEPSPLIRQPAHPRPRYGITGPCAAAADGTAIHGSHAARPPFARLAKGAATRRCRARHRRKVV